MNSLLWVYFILCAIQKMATDCCQIPLQAFNTYKHNVNLAANLLTFATCLLLPFPTNIILLMFWEHPSNTSTRFTLAGERCRSWYLWFK